MIKAVARRRLSFMLRLISPPYDYIQVVHDITAEKLFLKDLVAAGVVTDLTGGV